MHVHMRVRSYQSNWTYDRISDVLYLMFRGMCENIDGLCNGHMRTLREGMRERCTAGLHCTHDVSVDGGSSFCYACAQRTCLLALLQ